MEFPQNAPACCGTLCFYRQGLTLVCNCSQLPEVWLPAAGTPLLQSRPGGGNHPVIGPVAMVAWCGGRDRGHSKGDGPTIGLTHFQPRTPRGVLRGERPKRVLVPFARPKGTPSGERPHQAGKPEPRSFRRTIFESALHMAGIDAKKHRAGEGERLLLPDVSYFLVSNPAMLRTGAYSTAATGHTIQVRSQAMVQKLQPR